MNSPLTTITQHHEEKQVAKRDAATAKILTSLIQADRYVGEVFSVGYTNFVIQVHDSFRRDVSGISQGTFLLATRINPNSETLKFDTEDSEIVLLRVMEPNSLPRDGERQDQRADAVSRAMQGDTAWEAEVDEYTHNNLSFGGLNCRVLGTIYVEESPDAPDGLRLRLGTDIDNFYSGRGMKVYKPSADALKQVVNYRDPEFRSDHPLGDHIVNIATLRYGSTRRDGGSSSVEISITPADLIGQKTALFGMTRTGKSNTTKIIAQAIYELRRVPIPADPDDNDQQAAARSRSNRIGQLIFDPQGEYANENVQDGGRNNPNALKNIYNYLGLPRETEVATYGLMMHPRDPHRQLMKINVYGQPLRPARIIELQRARGAQAETAQRAAATAFAEDVHTLLLGKQLFNELLAGIDSIYIRNFVATDLTPPDFTALPDSEAYGQAVRYNRHLLVYRALLAGGGLPAPFQPDVTGLFSAELREVLRTPYEPEEADASAGRGRSRRNPELRDATTQAEFEQAAELLEKAQPSWDDIITVCKALAKLVTRPEFAQFDRTYRAGHDGRSWKDATLDNLLGMFTYSNGPKLSSRLMPNHEARLTTDYAQSIYTDLLNGKMVIIDQSLGGATSNQVVANKVIEKILQSHVEVFGLGEAPHPIMIYVEEAHNLLPKKSSEGEVNIWARLAKEGAKLNLGLVYATQEVSALQNNILKNTANWFIAHLNNSEEVREVSKYYDFADFAESILRSPNKGFIRMRTRTNVFSIPVQVKKFELNTSAAAAPTPGGTS